MNRCRECLAEVSPGAAHCPQCGRELGPPVTLPPSDALQPGKTGNWRIASIVFAVVGVVALLVIIGTVIGLRRDETLVPPEQGNVVTASPSPPQGAPVAVTAEELGKAYEENGLAARDRFEGGPIRVTGAVLRIGSNQGEPTISLQSSLATLAAFADPAPLKALKSGQQVTIRCEALTETAAVLSLSGCVLDAQPEAPPPVGRRDGPQ